MIMEIVGNSSFTLTTGNSKRNGYDASRTVSHRDLSWRPFSSTSSSLTCQTPSSYVGDLATMHADGDWQAVEGMLSRDMATVDDEYFQTWKLNLKTSKTVSTVFHLKKRKLNVS